MELLTPNGFSDYALLDCGDFLKFERFGEFLLIRPEPQALWKPAAPLSSWRSSAHAEFVPKSSSSGTWKKLRPMPDQWTLSYNLPQSKTKISFRLALTGFKHVGIFPEQAVNWDYIFRHVSKCRETQPQVLNLFAYTGGASLAAAAAGAVVTHVDSIRQVLTWANRNMELSSIKDIRWVLEDALKFVKREVKRGRHYHGIILDPPAYGHGTDGEKWKLEDHLSEMMSLVFQLLHPEEHFLILNAYSLGLSSLVIENLLKVHTNKTPAAHLQTGELYLAAESNVKLPLGVFGRINTALSV